MGQPPLTKKEMRGKEWQEHLERGELRKKQGDDYVQTLKREHAPSAISDETLLNNHWLRIQQLKDQYADSRSLFEAYFDYIETFVRSNNIRVRDLGTSQLFAQAYLILEYEMPNDLKRDLKRAGIYKDRPSSLKVLRQLSPISSNRSPDQKVFLTKDYNSRGKIDSVLS